MHLHPDAHLLRRASKSPEQLLSHVPEAEGFLAAAVISQAFWDAGWLTGSDVPAHGTGLDRDQARLFLLATSGEWAAARGAWATAANIDPDYVRDLALRLEKNPRRERQPHKRPSLREPGAPRGDTAERVRERVEYLKSRGIDVETETAGDIARVLNAAGIRTPQRNCRYSWDSAMQLKASFAACVKYGLIEP